MSVCLGGGSGALVDGEEGDWCTITQKKAKKKKKKQKPVPLNEFISSSSVQTELIRTSGAFRTVSPSNLLPELAAEEALIAESLRSYFADVLRRLGPARLDGAKLREEILNLDPEGREVIERFPSLGVFLAQSEDIQIIDNFLCCRDAAGKAKRYAVENILASVAANKTNKKLTGGAFNQFSSSHTPPSSAPIISTHVNPWLTNSLTSSTSDHMLNAPSTVSSSPFKLSNSISMAQQPIQKPSSIVNATSKGAGNLFSNSLGGFGTIGTMSSIGGNSGSIGSLDTGSTLISSSSPESINKKLQALSKCNSELLAKLGEKEKEIFEQNQKLVTLAEGCGKCNKLQAELSEVKEAMAKLKMNPTSQMMLDDKEPTTDNHLVIQLQKQLESERLNSRNLKQQLEIERAYSSRIAEKQNMTSLMNGSISSSNGSSLRPNRSDDSLGLRGLLSNIPPLNSGSQLSSSVKPSSSTTSLASSSTGILGGLNSSLSNNSLSLGGFGTSSSAMGYFNTPPPMPGNYRQQSSLGGLGVSSSNMLPAAKKKTIFEHIRTQCPGMTESLLDMYVSKLRTEMAAGQFANCALPKIMQMIKTLYDNDRGNL